MQPPPLQSAKPTSASASAPVPPPAVTLGKRHAKDAQTEDDSASKRVAIVTRIQENPLTDLIKLASTHPANSVINSTLQTLSNEIFTMLNNGLAPNAESWASLCVGFIRAMSAGFALLSPLDEASDASATNQVLRQVRDFAHELSQSTEGMHLDDYDAPATEGGEPSGTPSDRGQSSLESALTELRTIVLNQRQHFNQLERQIHNLSHRDSRSGHKAQPMPPPNQSTTNKPSTSTTNPTYATIVAANATSSPTQTTVQQAKKTHTTTSNSDFIKFIVRFQGNPPPLAERLPPEVITRKINMAFKSIPSSQKLEVLGARWNLSHNIVLSFEKNAPINRISAHVDTIKKAIGADDAIISQDVKWSKLVLAGVPTSAGLTIRGDDSPMERVASEDDILESLLKNEKIKNLTITQNPRWLRPAEDIQNKFRSSISFAFVDPDGSTAKNLLRSELYIFGARVRAKRWEERPRLRQCANCWRLGHTDSDCKSRHRCFFCGSSRHRSDRHRENCEHCFNRPNSEKCSHFKCVNCSGPHVADSLACPDRGRFRPPARPDHAPRIIFEPDDI